MGDRLEAFCLRKKISLNTMVHRMLIRLGRLHDQGRMCLLDKSRFRKRIDKKDKETTCLTLQVNTREMVKNLAFTYRISMAEVIRLGLEAYMDLEDLQKGIPVLPLHIYRLPEILPKATIALLFPALPPNRIPYPILI